MENRPSYLDVNLTPEERAKDLVSRMTLEEKASQLKYDAPAVKRLGVPYYNWWNEALHGVARAGTATVFPQAIGLAAMFDDAFLGQIADIIATEGRAKYNEQTKNEDRDIYKGITFWSPNINIFRDPRWGRGHETYGEDPYLTTRLGVAFVKGLQGDGAYLKGAACAKHFAVHSGPEGERHSFNAIVSDKDLWETYLPAFEALVKEADVESVMGAYNAVGGEPCCGSKTLLKDILRDKWAFKGHVVSDCWAIRDFHTNHMVTSTAPESAALALKNGCDLNCGNTYLHMLQAYEQGLVTEEDITTSCERLMTTRIKLGMFDTTEYDTIPYELNDCKLHHEAALEAARKSVVLLKNDGVLPLNKDKLKNIAVIGPNANSRAILKANYCGTASKYITLLEGIQDAAGEDVRVFYSEGCHLYKDRVEPLAFPNDRISEAVSIARLSDVVVLCLGLDADLEGEEGDTGNSYAAGDKPDLKLPGLQQKLLEKVTEVGKPVIVLLSTGSAMAVDYADENCSAVLQTWYPGALGGQAVAQLLFGKYSPSGKLPVTFYRETDVLPDFTDYSMKNRTYRYIENEPLYPFGYGLTYGDVNLTDLKLDQDEIRAGEGLKGTVVISNESDGEIEEVIQVYVKIKGTEYEVLNHRLCDFKRVNLQKGEKKAIEIDIKSDSFKVIDNKGNKIFDGNEAIVYVGISGPDTRSQALTQKEVLTKKVLIK
ncbi:glycoside hydrolase family 3 C-terminal domain-containing protein [Cellulosilyticum sp. I15G10I2]|uniref:glycoside hydrolase family 3 C-terminal domain-containing protein n=1 Tax=Cellulosilyticum sp. I15G10I2 TaxID=1892843 RepID=UPI00085C8CB3|nr:glycoside hydrolase family 3 C-terminal domain-containing protein [Cellulosilyticum sp. I15G10I2]